MRNKNKNAYNKFAETNWAMNRECTLRGQLEFVELPTPIDIEEVEPAANIIKRFCTGKSILLKQSVYEDKLPSGCEVNDKSNCFFCIHYSEKICWVGSSRNFVCVNLSHL